MYKVLTNKGLSYFAMTDREITDDINEISNGNFPTINRKHTQYCIDNNVDLYVYKDDELKFVIHDREAKK